MNEKYRNKMHYLNKDYLQNLVKHLLPTEAEENSREQYALHLASLGWSLPIQFTDRQLLEISKPEHSQSQVDSAMLSFFTENSFSILQKLILEDVIEDPDFEPWKDMVVECYESFKQNRYLVVVPTLLTVLEGYLSLKNGKLKSKNVKMIAPTRNKVSEVKCRLEKTAWLSISAIIDNLYSKSDFTDIKPDNLNRHWVLHGRMSPPEAKINSVKLFNILGSLSITQ